MSKILEIKNLSFSYDKVKILNKLNLEVNNNEFVALIGQNGAGKSTLLNLILGNYGPNEGEIFLFGDNIKDKNHYEDIAYISQNSVLMYKDFPTTVEEVLKIHLRYLKVKDDVLEYLKLVELEEHSKKSLNELSGGQLQRVALVIALIKKANLVILDEPTSGIDKKFSKELFKILNKLVKEGKTIIMVTHNLKDVISWVDKVLCIEHGECKFLTEHQVQREL